MSVINTFKNIRNNMFSRRNKKSAKAEALDFVPTSDTYKINPLLHPERPPVDAVTVYECECGILVTDGDTCDKCIALQSGMTLDEWQALEDEREADAIKAELDEILDWC